MNVFIPYIDTLVIGAMEMPMPMYPKYRLNAVWVAKSPKLKAPNGVDENKFHMIYSMMSSS
jgi:hypothetical protein